MIWPIMIAYQYAMLLLDACLLYMQCLLVLLTSVYRIFYPPKMKSVVGEIVLITETGRGIGRELAIQLARIGAKVVCLDYSETDNKNTLADIKKEGGSGWAFRCDVSNRDDIANVSEKIRNIIGDISIIINSTGMLIAKEFKKHSAEEIEKIFRYNFLSLVWAVHEWLPTFQESGRGHVVAVSSFYGVIGTPNLIPFSASKFAVTGFMESLTEEMRYGNQNPYIRTTLIHPFFVTSDHVHPRVRFPSLTRILSAEECATQIIRSVRREDEIAFIPNSEYYWTKLFLALPRKMQHAFLDFLDTGVDAIDGKCPKPNMLT